jgi:hypothetical protein
MIHSPGNADPDSACFLNQIIPEADLKANLSFNQFSSWLFISHKESQSDVTIVVFLVFPTVTSNLNVESLRGQAIAKQLRDTVKTVKDEIGKRLYEICLRLVLESFTHQYSSIIPVGL